MSHIDPMASTASRVTYDLVAEEYDNLVQHGYRAYAPTLYGHGLDHPPRLVMLDQMALQAVQELIEQNLCDVVLVGWSLGGIVAQAMYELVPDRICQAIWVNAFLLDSDPEGRGESCLDVLAQDSPEFAGRLATYVDKEAQTVMLPYETFAPTFMPDTTPAMRQAVYDTLHPQPLGPLMEKRAFPVFWAAVRADSHGPYVPTTSIISKQDVALGPGFVERQRDRLGPNCQHIDLPKGAHEVPYTQPVALANALEQAIVATTVA